MAMAHRLAKIPQLDPAIVTTVQGQAVRGNTIPRFHRSAERAPHPLSRLLLLIGAAQRVRAKSSAARPDMKWAREGIVMPLAGASCTLARLARHCDPASFLDR